MHILAVFAVVCLATGFALECYVCKPELQENFIDCNNTKGVETNCTFSEIMMDTLVGVYIEAKGAVDEWNSNYYIYAWHGYNAEQAGLDYVKWWNSTLEKSMKDKIGEDDENFICMKMVLREPYGSESYVRRGCSAKSADGEDPCTSATAKAEVRNNLVRMKAFADPPNVLQCSTCTGDLCNAATIPTPIFFIHSAPFLLLSAVVFQLFSQPLLE